jgi:hypothetical protein
MLELTSLCTHVRTRVNVHACAETQCNTHAHMFEFLSVRMHVCAYMHHATEVLLMSLHALHVCFCAYVCMCILPSIT